MKKKQPTMTSLVNWAKSQGISDRRARVLADEGRIEGAMKIGRNWIVPTNAKRMAA